MSGKFQSRLFEILVNLIDPSVFVDRYVEDSIDIWGVQFSPNGQLLATGASDGKIRVCTIFIDHQSHSTLRRYGISP